VISSGRKIRILHVINSLACGGIQRQMTNLVKNLQQDKFESAIISYDNNIFFDDLGSITVKKIPRTSMFIFKAPLETAEFINSWEPDIVHVWNIFALPVVYAAWPLIKRKPVFINGTLREAPLKIPLFKKIISKTFGFHKYVVANSESSLRSFGQAGKPGRFVIYNGFDFSGKSELCKSDAEKQVGFPPDKTKIAMIASLSGLKDHYTFIKAAKLCFEKADDMIFYIIGDGPDRLKLESLAASLDLQGNVIFTGHRKDIAVILRAIDISVLLSPPTHSEGFPNAVLESLANGVPAIVSNSGGSKELIKDRENGFLVSCGSAEMTRDCIMALKESVSLCNQMSLCALKSAERFSIRKMSEEFSSLYTKVVDYSSIQKQ